MEKFFMPFDLKIVSFCIQSKNQKVCLFQTGDLSVTFQFEKGILFDF